MELTPSAEAVYMRICTEAEPHITKGNTSHPKVKLLRIIDECIDRLIPHEPFSADRRLAGALSHIYRVKKGRFRICYSGMPGTETLTVLFISETLRKEGDQQDPYRIFTKMVMSGSFDGVFEKLGLRRPERKSLPPLKLQ